MGFFSRRGFLKAFGLTTAVAMVEPTRATLSLFGSNEAKAATSAMGYHQVVFRRPVCVPETGETTIRTWHLSVGPTQRAQVVGRIQSQFPKHYSWMLDNGHGGNSGFPEWDGEIVVGVPPTNDPYIGFYKAAEKIRQLFADKCLQRIQSVDKELRSGHRLVSVVHLPIHARPTGHRFGEPFVLERGFEVACDCDTRVVTYLDLKGWEVYSQFGEIPIEVPTEIQMKVLLQYDTDIVNRAGKGWERYQRT